MKKLLSIVFFLCVTLGVCAQGVKPLPSIHVEGKWLVDTHGNHVVLHGVMDTPSCWFNGGRWGWEYNDAGRQRCLTYYEKIFTGLEKAKCTAFRLHLEPAWTNDNSYTYVDKTVQPKNDKGEYPSGEADITHFNPTRLTNYMKTLYFPLMLKAMKHGMYVVVRPPGVCPGTIRVGDYYQKYLMQVWDIVTKNDSIRKYAGQISIELANEPVSVKDAMGADNKKALHDFFQPVVDKIRANGFTGIIWVPGAGWQASYADYKTYPIEGYNIGYAVHDYDGWYGCEDKKNSASTVATATKNKITQFHNQVPVVDTNPVIITEIDWSPKKSDVVGHENEHGEQVEGNLGTWATGRTSVWGTITKGVYDHYGNISMTLSGTACLLDVDTLINKGKVVAAFNAEPEACGKACMDWYAEYYEKNWAHRDFATTPLSEKGTKYENPVVRADFPDPDVIRVGTTYYMVSTTMHHFPGATILKSQDMVNWEYCAQPLKQLLNNDNYNLKGDKNAYASGMWACSMKYNDGKFYILVNGNDSKAWLLSAANPEGKWDVKRLGRNYYDPGMLFDNGKVYVVCGINRLMMCELDKNFNFKKEKEVVYKEGTGLEGCHLYKKGDYYYIYATYGGWPSGQTVFRSKDIFGPYEEQDKMLVEKYIDNVPNTIHQGALVEDVNGGWWTIMQQDLGCLGRFPNLQPVKWTNEWPIVGNNGKPYETYTKPKAAGNITVKRLPTDDAFRTYPLGKQWEWNHLPDNNAWSLFERAGWLRLKTSGVVSSLPQARNMLTQRIFMDKSKPSTGTVRVDVRGLKDGDVTGICVFQDPYAMIAVQKDGDKFQLLWKQDKVRDAGSNFSPAEKTADIELTDSIIYLRASMNYSTSKAKFYYSVDNKTWKVLGNETQQSFNLSVFVGSRFGLFCYATKAEGGMADFDWFTTEAEFDEADLYPVTFTAPTENMFAASKIIPAKKTYELMVGDKQYPIINATFADNHKENVAAQTTMVPEDASVVDFTDRGCMTALDQGTTLVKASYTDLLGTKVDTSFTAKVSYFPLDVAYINTSIAGTGNYKQNAANSVFKFVTEKSQIGWEYKDGIDITGYKYLVINLLQAQTADAHLNIYTSDKITGACYSTESFGKNLQIVVDLDEAKYTSSTNKGKALDRSKVKKVTFTGLIANKTLVIKEMFLSNDEQYNTGISDVNRLQRTTEVDVYTLSGLRVRHAANCQEALQGLSSGIYIIGGRKVVVK